MMSIQTILALVSNAELQSRGALDWEESAKPDLTECGRYLIELLGRESWTADRVSKKSDRAAHP